MRSLNPSLKPIIRGQRLPFDNPDAKVVRAFVHWTDETGGEDLDLSYLFIGDNKKETLNFGHPRIGNSILSGDVRHRRGPCAEYVDVDIQNALSLGYRYILMDCRNYNGRGLNTVKAYFGMMERQFPEASLIWYPETVTGCIELNSPSVTTVIAILDLKTREYIFLDVDSNSGMVQRSNDSELQKLIDYYTEEPKVNVYTLLELHTSRGEQTDNIEEADTLFMFDDFSKSYEKIAGLML